MRTVFALIILLILGIAVRLVAGWIHPADLTADNDGYLAHAEMVANGAGFAGPYTDRPTAFRPPAYPVVLAAMRMLKVPNSASVAIINGGCSIAIIWLTWIFCGQLRMSPGVSIFATAITAFDPLLVRYTILPMTEVPAAAILIAAVVALRAAESDSCLNLPAAASPSDGNGRQTQWWKTVRWYVLSGILFGLGSLVRPILLVSCGMLILLRLFQHMKYDKCASRNVAMTILPMIVAIVAISPWIIRNAVQFGKFIPATTHGGYTLALGNNPDFYRDVIDGEVPFPWPGPLLNEWQQRMIVESAFEGIPVGDEPAQDAWYYQRAIAAMKMQPLSFIKACLLRLGRFCAILPGADDGLPWLITMLIAIWYGIIGLGVIAAISQCLLPRRQIPKLGSVGRILPEHSLADLWLVVLSFMLLHALYWTDTRMRAPVMPFVCIIAAVGWQFVFKIFLHHSSSDSTSEPTT